MMPHQIGRYEIKSELGRGGMASVYLAYDPAFKREVAVKVLPREFLHDPAFRTRFEREAQIIGTLEHPAIVPVYDFGEDNGQPYIVMRYMAGGSLSDRIKRGPLSLSETARILRRIGPALDEAHRRGIIHRDLKPGNILFDQYDEAYLSDFGIAKLAESGSTLTGSGVIGTPAYMSPEQASGEPDIDARSDIYSLGAIVFEMLSGMLPYHADTPMGMVVKHITEPVPHIRELRGELPPACDAVIARAMAKDRSERYQTASELADALAALVEGKPAAVPAPAVRPLEATQRLETGAAETQGPLPAAPARARRGLPPWVWIAGILAAVACFAVVLTGLVVLNVISLRAGPETPPALASATPTPPPTSPPETSTPTLTPTLTESPPPAFTPTSPLEPVLIHPYCSMDNESPVYVDRGRPVILVWTWTALRAEQVQDHIEASLYQIYLDGQPIEAQRRSEIEYDSQKQVYKVSWFADVGILPPGEHLAERFLSWTRLISDGWDTYGPGGEIETEYHDCLIIVR
jgi:serine/threonine-protein kinase